MPFEIPALKLSGIKDKKESTKFPSRLKLKKESNPDVGRGRPVREKEEAKESEQWLEDTQLSKYDVLDLDTL